MASKTVGLITEYNPLHNGHAYHIQKAKELTGADNVIVIMSGNFLQRGEPAIIDKYSRTKMALLAGADLVIELPFYFACSSAYFFAHGAISLLEKCGCIDYLCFGSETDDIASLTHIAKILSDEPYEYRALLKEKLSEGFSFPKARLLALQAFSDNASVLSDMLEGPNNILGIEYIRALLSFNSTIKPVTIKRSDNGYHSLNIDSCISSATSIRHCISQNNWNFSHAVPDYVYALLQQKNNICFPVRTDDFSLLLHYKLLSEKSNFEKYTDISEDFSNAIQKNIGSFNSFDDFAFLLKNKNYTYTRISRCLFHILLNHTTDKLEAFKQAGYGQYLHVLGFNKNSDIMKKIKENSKIMLITKTSDAINKLDSIGKEMLNADIFAADVYNSIIQDKFGQKIANDYQHRLEIISR